MTTETKRGEFSNKADNILSRPALIAKRQNANGPETENRRDPQREKSTTRDTPTTPRDTPNNKKTDPNKEQTR